MSDETKDEQKDSSASAAGGDAGDEAKAVGEAVDAGDEAKSEAQDDDAKSDDAKSDDAKGDGAKGDGAEDEHLIETLDLTRGEVDDADLAGLDEAINAIDFAARRASEDRLARLKGMHERLGDLIGQIERGERAPRKAHEPLTAEEEARYQALIDEAVDAGQRRELEVAQRLLEEAVLLNSEGIDGLFNLGVVYGLLAHHNIAKAEFYDDYTRDEIFLERARICYDRLLNLEPGHLPSLINLATLYSMRDDRQTAIAYLETVVGSDPSSDAERHLIREAKAQLEELRTF